jgi:hypothetical protein
MNRFIRKLFFPCIFTSHRAIQNSEFHCRVPSLRGAKRRSNPENGHSPNRIAQFKIQNFIAKLRKELNIDNHVQAERSSWVNCPYRQNCEAVQLLPALWREVYAVPRASAAQFGVNRLISIRTAKQFNSLRSCGGKCMLYPEQAQRSSGLSIFNSLRSLTATVKQFTKLCHVWYKIK